MENAEAVPRILRAACGKPEEPEDPQQERGLSSQDHAEDNAHKSSDPFTQEAGWAQETEGEGLRRLAFVRVGARHGQMGHPAVEEDAR
jgi:hypothetical protein